MRFPILFAGAALLFSAPALCATYSVCPDGSGDFVTIQAAIDGAISSDTIELCDAVFSGAGNRDIDFHGLAITVRSLSGNAEDCVVDCGGSGGDPHRGFTFHSGEGSDSVLEGITIRNAVSFAPGGGIHCDGASPTIRDCILEFNLCMELGAGLYCANGAPTIAGCRFVNNGDGTGMSGGGIACLAASPTVTDCVFENNRVQAGGGGMYCGSGSSPTLIGCRFAGNEVTAPNAYGAGLFSFYYSSPTLEDCEFIENSGGGGGGGAAFNDHCDPVLTRCRFSDNSSDNGGGLYFLQVCAPSLDSCTVIDNSATYYGGALWSSMCTPTLTCCTLSGNSAGIDGGGIHLNQSSPTIQQTVIAFSTSGQAVYCYGTGCAPVLTCCDVYGNAGGDWVGCISSQDGLAGNIGLDPLFCRPWDGDYHLTSDSPCAPFSDPNPECDQIGALPVDCTLSGLPDDVLAAAPAVRIEASPNPTSSSTRICYELPEDVLVSSVMLRVFDASGRLVRTLPSGGTQSRQHQTIWDGCGHDGTKAPGGIYYVQLSIGGERLAKRLVLIH